MHCWAVGVHSPGNYLGALEVMLARSTILPASRLIPRSSALQYAIVSTGARRATSTAAKNRPLSPHLEIYKFPFNAITSVAFRATGILLTTGAYRIVWAWRAYDALAAVCRPAAPVASKHPSLRVLSPRDTP